MLISKPASHVLTKQNKCSGYTLDTSPHIFGLAKWTVSVLYFSVLKVLPPPLTKGRAVPDCACVHINPSCWILYSADKAVSANVIWPDHLSLSIILLYVLVTSLDEKRNRLNTMGMYTVKDKIWWDFSMVNCLSKQPNFMPLTNSCISFVCVYHIMQLS